ncbi:hypothetical protein C5O80_15270 [Burkholderia sp. SRS-46]|nr:hypothetical protein C5O80_15270 [Burkholderia sp. SRS-46]
MGNRLELRAPEHGGSRRVSALRLRERRQIAQGRRDGRSLFDATDHGGKVETGSSTMKFDGRYVARKGDRVSCPQHPDISPNLIEEGDSSMTDGGIPIARHGHCATCGCHLISSLV